MLVGPGAPPARSARRVNAVLTAVRGMVVHAVTTGRAAGIWCRRYTRWPTPGTCREPRAGMRPGCRGGCGHGTGCTNLTRHVDRASDEQIVAVLQACRSARDALIVLLMARAGLRRGEALGLRRADVHLLADSARWAARWPIARACGPSRGQPERGMGEVSQGGWCRWTS